MASILKIAIHSIKIPYSAYIESPVAFNSLKEEYIRPEIKAQYIFRNMEDYAAQNENAQYFMENRQYMKFLLENMNKKMHDTNELVDMPYPENSIVDIESLNLMDIDYTIKKRHHNSFS
jgi:isopentenyl diphosphate isomerase/L-lactate dehydrogenase-like FMN-dependent dehydrogenase